MTPGKELTELDHLLQLVATQNYRLRLVVMAMAAMLVGGVVVVAFIALSLSNLRERDLEDIAERRAAVRWVAAEASLRGCRNDEEQDEALAVLLRTVLRTPPLPNLTPERAAAAERIRRSFRARIRKTNRGRRCLDIPALKFITEAERRKLARLYPRAS